MADLTKQERRYNSEYLLADSFWEFHRDAFEILSDSALNDLLAYYPQDSDVGNVFNYRRQVLSVDRELHMRARSALQTVLKSLGVTLDP